MHERHVDRARLTLIAALAGVFFFFGIDKFLRPLLWIGWIPAWLDGFFLQKSAWLQVIGASEIALALALLIPKRQIRTVACFLMIVQLIGVLSQVGFNDVFVRDAGLLLSAVALWFLL